MWWARIWGFSGQHVLHPLWVWDALLGLPGRVYCISFAILGYCVLHWCFVAACFRLVTIISGSNVNCLTFFLAQIMEDQNMLFAADDRVFSI